MTTLLPLPSPLRWALALSAALSLASAWAQTEPNPDPPGRVGRVSLVEGSMSVAPQGSSAWVGVLPNRPLTTGDRLWTAERTRAEMHLGAHAARIGSATDVKLLVLDDEVTHVQLTQGTLSLRVRQLFDGQSVQIDTPNLGFSVGQPGEYRIDVDPLRNATRIAVASGSGVAYGEGGQSVPLGNRQQLTFGGTALALLASQEVAQRDGFDTWAADRDRAEDQSPSARYVSREVVGYQQLDQHGDWSSDATLGPVWVPRTVAVDWAPYRFGHWEFILPWGWTWVDDAPWGFAPFHYGRWAYLGTRWAWVPGPLTARPVYAPALVVFVGGSFGSTARQPGVAWFPLAPGEAWQPGYRTSPRYISRANPGAYSSQFDERRGYRHQQMPRAVTAVSADNFSQGRPVRHEPHRVRNDEFRRAPVQAAPPVAPDPRTPFLGLRAAPTQALPPASLSQQDALARRAAAERAAGANDGRNDGWRQRGQDEGRFQRGNAVGTQPDFGRGPAPGPSPGVQSLPAQQFPAPAVQAPVLRQPPPTVQSTELPSGRVIVNPTVRVPPVVDLRDNREAERQQRMQQQQQQQQQQQREQEMRAQQDQRAQQQAQQAQRAQAEAQARSQAEAQARGQAEAQQRAQMEAQARANAQAQQAQAQAAAEAQARAQAQQRAAPPPDAGRPLRPGSPQRQPNEAKDGRGGSGNDDERRGRWQGQPR